MGYRDLQYRNYEDQAIIDNHCLYDANQEIEARDYAITQLVSMIKTFDKTNHELIDIIRSLSAEIVSLRNQINLRESA